MAKSSKSRVTSKTKRPAPLEGNKVWRNRGRVRRAGPTQRDVSWWAQRPSAVQHAICIGFLTLVALGFFASTTFGGDTLAGGDTVQWRATAEVLLAAEAETGTRPLWVPNVFGGMPAYLVSYPTATPGLDTIVSQLRAWGLWPFAHMMVLLLGTYFLVLFLTRSKLAGATSTSPPSSRTAPCAFMRWASAASHANPQPKKTLSGCRRSPARRSTQARSGSAPRD